MTEHPRARRDEETDMNAPVKQANWNQASMAAEQLMLAARHLAEAVSLVENLHRFPTGSDVLKAEEQNADEILSQAPELVQAIREIGLRFERNAGQYDTGEFPKWWDIRNWSR